MPLTMRGSVRARLSVRFSTVRASRNELRSQVKTSIPPGIHGVQALLAGDDRQRCAVLGAGFGKHQRASGKIEGCQTLASSQLCLRGLPVQPAGNHQVQHQPEIAFDSNRDALADAPQLSNDLSFHICYRGLHGAEQKRTGQSHMLDPVVPRCVVRAR